jgi:hypothetical protein
MADELKDFNPYTKQEDSPNREAPQAMERGTKAYKQMISDSSKQMDKYGNLPFTFGKPPKGTAPRRDKYVKCECGRISAVNKNTCGLECGGCKRYFSINEANIINPQKEDE